jgi:Aminotransferase class-III
MNLHTYATHTLMEITARPSTVFVKGEGSWLWDHNGKRYLDFVQGWAVNCLGHSPPAVVDAISRQARELITPSPAYYNDGTGKIVREGMVASNPEVIAAFIKSHAPHVVRIGLEAGATSTWLWTELNMMGLPVICIDARHAKAAVKMQINKSDRNDAFGIARNHAMWLVQGGARQRSRQSCDQGSSRQ